MNIQDKTSTTIKAYNESAQCYAAKFACYEPYAKHINEFAAMLKDGFNILDIGCGPGNVAKQLSESRSLRITGIDLSEEMLAMARRELPQGKFILQDVCEANFPAEHYDAVVLSFSIVHLQDGEACDLLINAAKWLKRDGYIYVSFMEGKKPGYEITSFSNLPIYYHYFQESWVKQILQENNVDCFKCVKQDYIEPDGSSTIDVFLFGRKQ